MEEPNKVGRPKAIKNPEHLWELFLAYKQGRKNDPYLQHDFVGKEGIPVHRKKEKPLTWDSFDCYVFDLEIISDLRDYRDNTDNRYDEYKAVISRIDRVMRDDKFSGAAAGIYQQNIIARDLGLVDKKEQQVNFEQPLFPDVQKNDSDK